ncbi:Hsp70 family protein-like protein [Amylocarpus encephaloides]|uniref:Hsp70 family protein-like protein n=1 Tax=Amylocarpus encephaloides TaxID=45428 RepID=A0A9P8C3R8_9HELO|nr:Hsp70 family protein-like protein [Amylocarpus encephaloides]
MASNTSNSDSDDRLIIGIDFGTTYSGAAYAFVNAGKKDVISIMDWPGLNGLKEPKIPTAICYDASDKSKFTWGAQKHNGSVIRGVKLLLDPTQPKPLYLPPSTARADILRYGKPPGEVTSDYIREISNHALKRITSSVPSGYVDMCEKEYVLTVPAVWSDRAKNVTLLAAKAAGMWPITLIKEPEAAALYAIHDMSDKGLKVGNSLVICDRGGGTVDLISYEITALEPRLELKELVPSKGGMSGSLGLNMRFENEVCYLIGEDQYLRIREISSFEFAMNHFDKNVKNAFRGDLEEVFYVMFPGGNLIDDLPHNLSRDTWQLKDNAPSKKIAAIILVGDFGDNEYLKNRLEQNHQGIQVIRPSHAWSAIVKGAVLSQLQDKAKVVSTIAPRHYGVAAMVPFVESRDKDMLQSESAIAPTYLNYLVTDNCTLIADFTEMDRKKLKKRTGVDGKIYFKLGYDLVVTIKSAIMNFSLEIDGKVIGSVEAKYE